MVIVLIIHLNKVTINPFSTNSPLIPYVPKIDYMNYCVESSTYWYTFNYISQTHRYKHTRYLSLSWCFYFPAVVINVFRAIQICVGNFKRISTDSFTRFVSFFNYIFIQRRSYILWNLTIIKRNLECVFKYLFT